MHALWSGSSVPPQQRFRDDNRKEESSPKEKWQTVVSNWFLTLLAQ